MTYGPAGQTNAEGNPRFDNVFVQPSAYKTFLKTGQMARQNDIWF